MSDIEKSARTAVKLFAGACLALGLGAGAIIRGDSGTHFDPELVEKFDRIALDLHEKAGFGQAESKAQELMREQIQKHFGI